ncbi:OB-fold nucleic acid binding domain-containing protein, partial [bacterium]|nr:OB-fold nucleic acid binding domain-containing protein [bacterium]
MMRNTLVLPLFVVLFTLTTSAQTITTIAEINACDDSGVATFPGISTLDYYTIEGVALNDADVFNGEGDASFILYVQDDTGGIQVYSGAWYEAGLAIYPVIQQGEHVRVTGLTGFYGGKTNINDRHNKDLTFTIERLGEAKMPEPYVITDLEAAQQFDQTR